MKIIQVAPISKGISKEELSYFYRDDIAPGSLVTIPLRNKNRPALVIGSREATAEKASIKNSSFALKKIISVEHEHFFLPEFISTAKNMADYYAGTVGSVLSLFVPESIFEHAEKLETHPPNPAGKGTMEKCILHAEDENRFSYYKTLIREQFAKKNSLLFLVPTIQSLSFIKKHLERGIEEYCFALHSYKKVKDIVSTWNDLLHEKHPIVLFATPKFMSVPRADFKTIVIEQESASSYKLTSRPYVDARVFAESYAAALGARSIRADLVPSLETKWHAEEGDLLELLPSLARLHPKSKASIIDMRNSPMTPKRGFNVLSKELEKLIQKTRTESAHLAILTARRGIAPSTVCGDCGSTVSCLECSAPVVLHKSKDKPNSTIFLCHRCGRSRPTEERCRVCTSWKLVPLGIGVDRVVSEIKEKFPTTTLFVMDRDSVKNQKQASAVASQFLSTPGGVLVGTELFLNFLEEQVEGSAVASIDSLFAIPDYRINEKIFSLLLRLRMHTKQELLVQTRNPDETVLLSAVNGNFSSYYKKEIEERQRFGYPPFARFIKLTVQGERTKAENELAKIKQVLPYPMDIFPAFTEMVKGKHVVHGLIRLKPKEWPDKKLLLFLKSLPPAVRVEVDPESVL